MSQILIRFVYKSLHIKKNPVISKINKGEKTACVSFICRFSLNFNDEYQKHTH